MRIDSIVRLGAALLLLVATGFGCAKAPTIVREDLLEPLATRRPWLPSATDLAAARLARAALIADPVKASSPGGRPRRNVDASYETDQKLDTQSSQVAPRVARALAALAALPPAPDQDSLLPLGIDLRNTTLDDPVAYREGSLKLSKRRGLDPRLEGRLERTIGDDPLRLAGRRQFDGWNRLWARTFNAVVEPIGSSAITGFVLAPYQLTNSLIHYFAEFSNSEPLSSTDRQALALRRDFLARHPDTVATPELEKKIARDRVKLDSTLARRRLRAGGKALDAQEPALALYQAARALAILERAPDENARLRRQADKARGAAQDALSIRFLLRAKSLEAVLGPPELQDAEIALATQLLADAATPASLLTPIDTYYQVAESSGKADRKHAEARIEYIAALAQHEAGFEAGARMRLARGARAGVRQNTMVRHSRTLLDDDWQNPYGAFERLVRKGGRDELAWRLAGEWVRRPRYPNLPVPLAYLIDTPAIAITLIMAPLRAVISPWTGGTPDFRRGAALAGYRYLLRYPEGENQRPVIDWLYNYELSKERWGRALRMADWIPEFEAEERATLVEKTAEQRVERVEQLDRRDERASVLRSVAREFPDSESGRVAGLQARAERKDASPQFIRITRGFLIENPIVASQAGLGLNPALLNEDLQDGELHPEGIVLRGGRMLEIRLVAEGGSDDEKPASRFLELSPTRLKQLAATLEEAVQRNSLIDADARQEANANRDLFLERAGLGLTEELDGRPAAQSSFVYRSLRERYGAVRGRDSILPFDLVFRGSLGDFTLGAFPRWRPPKETPDAFLYR